MLFDVGDNLLNDADDCRDAILGRSAGYLDRLFKLISIDPAGCLLGHQLPDLVVEAAEYVSDAWTLERLPECD
jgi:hypothetical protein